MSEVRTIIIGEPAVGRWTRVEPGTPLGATEPDHEPNKIAVVRVNGVFIARAGWHQTIDEGDRVEWLIDPPGDRETFRTLLQVAVVAAALIPGAGTVALALSAASIAYNLLVPPHTPDQGAASKDVFSASISGNTANVDDPVPRVCGVDKVSPPFACRRSRWTTR